MNSIEGSWIRFISHWACGFLRTDMYLYAVDPVMNVIIDMDTLSQ